MAELVDSIVKSDDPGSVGNIVSVVELTGDTVEEVVVPASVIVLCTVDSEAEVDEKTVVEDEELVDSEVGSAVLVLVVCSDDELV